MGELTFFDLTESFSFKILSENGIFSSVLFQDILTVNVINSLSVCMCACFYILAHIVSAKVAHNAVKFNLPAKT